MDDELNEEPLSAEEVLQFGPCVEAIVWHPMWLQESRAPIAVAAGRPKLGRIFNDDGVGKLAIIRPCVSRGRRVRGLPPIYTPKMLEANAGVFSGWPSYLDHQPPELQAALVKRGRSVKELGGQILKSFWQRGFVHEDDKQYGYRPGAVLGEAWATPFLRELVGENPNLLHASINAWPTSGKPGEVPWRPGMKGMVIEGIRSQPQGSVDYVVRGGAGGRLLVAEGFEDEGAWPETGEWSAGDRQLVVSLAERLYASPHMSDVTLPTRPEELRDWLAEHAEHLLPALEADSEPDADDEKKKRRGRGSSSSSDKPDGLTEGDVRRLIEESSQGQPTVEEFEQQLTERTEQLLSEREEQRSLSSLACSLIESADGVPPSWKSDLKSRYAMLPSGPPATLLTEGVTDDDGNELSPEQVIEARVKRDLEHTRDLILEAQGRPRVKGQGGAKPDPSDTTSSRRGATSAHWRQRFAEMGLAESTDKALDIYGEKVEG